MAIIKLQGHMGKIDFDPNWMFLDCNPSLNSLIATKGCTKLEVERGVLLFFKDIGQIWRPHGPKIADFDPPLRFRTVTQVWSHRCLWNDGQNSMKYRSDALLFFKVIHGTTINQFDRLWFSGLLLQFEFIHGFAMLHKALRNTELTPCCFSRSSVKFEIHTGKKPANFYLNREFPECNSSLISPMPLKWWRKLNVLKKRCPIVF